MLKNYIKIAFKTFSRHKLFTFISLFGISFTLYFLIVIVSLFENTWGPGSPEINQKRTLWISDAELISAEGEFYSNGGVLSPWFLSEYVKALETPENVSLFSSAITRRFFVDEEKVELEIKYTDAEFWEIHDFSLLEGDYFGSGDVENRLYNAVISSGGAAKLFGDEGALGKKILIDGKSYTVKGVVEETSRLRMNTYAHIWIPLSTAGRDIMKKGVMNDFSSGLHFTAVILAEKRSDFARIREEFDTGISGVLFPYSAGSEPEDITIKTVLGTPPEAIGFSLFRLEKGSGQLFYAMSVGAIILFMLLPAINLVNINLSRIMERSVEIGVRKAYGASVSVLTGQFLIENIILTLIGGIISLVLSVITLEIISRSGVITSTDLPVNLKVYLFSAVIILFFGFLSGVVPALRMSSMEPARCLRGGEQ